MISIYPSQKFFSELGRALVEGDSYPEQPPTVPWTILAISEGKIRDDLTAPS